MCPTCEIALIKYRLTVAYEFIEAPLCDFLAGCFWIKKTPFADFQERQVDGVEREHRDARVEQDFQPSGAQLRGQAGDQGARNSCQQVLKREKNKVMTKIFWLLKEFGGMCDSFWEFKHFSQAQIC